MSEPRPTRVRVTGPPRHQRRPTPTSGPGPDPGSPAETPLTSLYAGALLRAQRAAAVRTLAGLAVVAAGVPLVFHFVPRLSDARLAGAPVPWLVIGVLAYPAMWLTGWLHLRRTERLERDYVALLRGEGDP